MKTTSPLIMKQFLLTAILMACTAFTFAQSHIEKTGEDLMFTEDEKFVKMLGEDGAYFYSMRKNTIGKGFNYFVEQYNKADLKKVKTIPLGNYVNNIAFSFARFRKNDDDKYLHQIYINKGKLYIIFDCMVLNENLGKLMLKTYDIEKGTVEKEEIIKSLPCQTKNEFYAIKFTFCQSPDSSKIGILTKTDGPDNSEDINYSFYQLNTLKSLGTKNLPNQFKNELIKTSTFTVDDKGDLMYLYWYKSDSSKTDFYNGGGLVKYSLLTNKLLNYNLKMRDNTTFFNFNYQYNTKTDKIYLYSMVYEGERDFDYTVKEEGFYITILNKNTLDRINEKITFFTPDIKKQLICGSRYVNFNTYYKPYLSFINDNEFFMILEGKTQSYDYILTAKEIIISKFDAELKSIWMKKIPRSIAYMVKPSFDIYKEENYCSRAFIQDSSHLNFIFLEHPKFDKKKDFQTVDKCVELTLITLKNSKCVKYSISANGELTKEILFLNKKADCIVPSDVLIKTAPNKYIVRFKNGKKESFGTLTLNQ